MARSVDVPGEPAAMASGVRAVLLNLSDKFLEYFPRAGRAAEKPAARASWPQEIAPFIADQHKTTEGRSTQVPARK